MTHRIDRKYIFLTALFAVYMFEYMVTSTLLNRGATGVLAVDLQVKLYYVDMAVCVLGFWVFAAGKRLVHGRKLRTALMGLVTVIYTACILQLFMVHTADVYLLIAPFTMLCLGIMGGMVYYCMSSALAGDPCIGRVIGIGGASAVLIQYFLQLKADISLGMPFILAMGLMMMAWLLYKPQWEWLLVDNLGQWTDETGHERSFKLSCICSVVITSLLILLCQYYDSRIEMQAVASEFESFNFYTWPRLFLVAAYLIMGCLGDIKNGKYVPLFTICVMLLSALNPLLLADKGGVALSLCLFYLNVGVTISYYNLTFLRLASKSQHPELWAGMGRILDGTIGTLAFLLQIEGFSLPLILGIDLVLLAGIIVLMVVRGDFAFVKETADSPKASEEIEKVQPSDVIDIMSKLYELTPRETEVLQKLLQTEDELQTIADSMYISRRVLSRHISAIYQKTGTKSRVGLYRLFHMTAMK